MVFERRQTMLILVVMSAIVGLGLLTGFLGCRAMVFTQKGERGDFWLGLIIASVAFLVSSLGAVAILFSARSWQQINGVGVMTISLITTTSLVYFGYRWQKGTTFL